MKKGPFLWVALDGLLSEVGEITTLDVVSELDRVPGDFGFKVNLDWALHKGIPNLKVGALDKRPLFVDLKMWNGARTMESVFWQMHLAGVAATNAYALAGGRSEKNGDQLGKAISAFHAHAGKNSGLRIYAVTVLTHYSEEYVRIHHGRSVAQLVRGLVIEGMAAGVNGVIMPGTQLSAVEDLRVTKILPGIRPDWYEDNRHQQEIRPEEVAGYTDIEVVCGSPILKDADPVAALKKVLSSLQA